ncbi:helix-turn-helix domain-containing protein [Inquilinus sp. Marseille-Q2685]|uniref:helix-turn-helix domain-containing protein n=1 Tax=Inquilinus sp. Marseille-Q2685 TaxID=2866581 RepID=UPI001CE498AA|nr:helix-turn-helix transcriptional regulator [Inquilinus sp. Marseille-Q2685]
MATRGSDRQRRRKTITEDGPDPVDVHVGARLRQRRTLLGMSQEKLAAAFGVSFQQIQKYERGANRVSASRLHQLTQILNVPVGYFFEGMTDAPQNGSAHPVHDSEMVASRETLELVRAYYRIEDATVRRRLVDLLRSLGPDAAEH